MSHKTKGQREYDRTYVTVELTPKSLVKQGAWTVYVVKANALLCTERKRVVARETTYRVAALVAQGYAQAAGLKLSPKVAEYRCPFKPTLT